MANIGLRIRVIESFFDKEAVLKAADRATIKALSKAGAFVRRRARSSIRKRKRVSSPGSPPSSHTGLYKDNIFFAYDRRRKSVVIGPVRLGGREGDAPEALELGGTFRRTHRLAGGRRNVVTATYRPRPTMGPALVTEAPNFPSLWTTQIHA